MAWASVMFPGWPALLNTVLCLLDFPIWWAPLPQCRSLKTHFHPSLQLNRKVTILHWSNSPSRLQFRSEQSEGKGSLSSAVCWGKQGPLAVRTAMAELSACLARRGVYNEAAVLQGAQSIAPVLGGSSCLLIRLVREHDWGIISEIWHYPSSLNLPINLWVLPNLL